MKKTFVLGVGSSKAGTTWLHEYLSAAPGVDGGPCKEYHIWDGLFVPESAPFRVTEEHSLMGDDWRLKWMMQNVPGYYHRYFESLLRRPGIAITMDITPPYSAVDATVLRQVREGFLALDIDVKAVFLMREPVERCWSMMRMMHGKFGKADEVLSSATLLHHARSRDCELRGRYDIIIPKLEQVFGAGEIYYGFYEDMFEAENIRLLSQFLGVPANPDFARQHFNTSARIGHIAPDVRAEIERIHAPTYDFVYKRFPKVRQLWMQQAAHQAAAKESATPFMQ